MKNNNPNQLDNYPNKNIYNTPGIIPLIPFLTIKKINEHSEPQPPNDFEFKPIERDETSMHLLKHHILRNLEQKQRQALQYLGEDFRNQYLEKLIQLNDCAEQLEKFVQV